MKKLSIAAALALATIFGTSSVRADHFAYVSVSSGDFGRLDLDTGGFSLIGNSGRAIAGMGVVNGILYASSYHTGADVLYTVDPTNGSLTAVGNSSINIDCFGGTTAGLFALGIDANLYSINPSTGAATLLGPIGLNPGSWRGFSTNSGTLYFGNGVSLYTLNTTTGAATLVGNMGGPQVGVILLEEGVLRPGPP
jgi:hypothetical protein